MTRIDESGPVVPNRSGPQLSKGGRIQQGVHWIAQRLHIAGTRSPESAISGTVHSPACQSPGSKGVDIPQIMQPGVMADRLYGGGRLTKSRGRLTVKDTTRRSRFFANLTPFTKKSSENARLFLAALAERSMSDDERVRNDAGGDLLLFVYSGWFQEVVRRDPTLERSVIQQAMVIFGPPCKENQVQWRNLQSFLPGPSPSKESPAEFFVNLIKFTEETPENAKSFLTALVQEAKEAKTPQEKESVQNTLELFTRSDWFKSVLKQYPNLSETLNTAAQEILGGYDENSRRIWGKIWASFNDCGLQEAASKVLLLVETARLLRPVASFVSIIPQGGMQLSVGDQTYLARPESLEGGATVLRFYEKEGGNWKEIGTVFVDPVTGRPSALDGNRALVDSLSPHLQDCMGALSEKIPEIVQKHLVPSVLASQNDDPQLRERGKGGLLDFATSEVFQELLHADERAGRSLLAAASKILGPPSQENKDSWLQIQQSLERGGAAEEAQTIQQLLEEVSVPLPGVESLQTVADLAGFLPKRGMPLQVGNQVYWARPEPSDQGTAFRFFVAEGGQWKEAGSVVMDSQSGAIISAFDGQQQPIMGLLPDLTGCIGEMSKKLRIIQEMTERLKKEGVDPAVAKKIIEQWTDQWRGCVESEDPETGLIVQRGEGPGSTDEERTNRIHGLKIRREESGLCADYTFEDIIEGSYKRVKKMVRINPDGTVVELVRYTRKKSEAVATSDELRERFVDDVRKEIGVREGLVENGRQLTGELSNEHLYDNILWMEDFDSHVGKDQQVKRRYVGERAPGGDLFDYRNKKINEAGNGPPKSLQEQSERFSTLIHLGVGALRGLHQLHARNYVHLDVKPENVLVFDDRAKLADFGLCRPEGTPTGFEGSPGYMPPELMGENENKPRCDRRMDMFSFGAMLLDSVCSVWKEQPMASLADEVYKTNEKALAAHQAFEVAKKAWESNPGDPGLKARLELAKNSLSTALGAMKKAIKNIQPVLQQRKGDPWILIADLIEYDPGKRTVTSEEAEKRLQRVNESLQRGQGLTVPVSSA